MLRVYLTGDLCVEGEATLVRGTRFPGLQGRVLFAMLAAADGPVDDAALFAELWDPEPPAAADVALRALVSKVRGAVAEAHPAAAEVERLDRTYRWVRPPETWIDLQAATDAIHRAETAARDGELDDAAGWGRVAATISCRRFLTGSSGPWATSVRRELETIQLRTLDCLARVWLATGDAGQAARDARRAIRIDPYRESSLRNLMRALAAAGDRAEALREYEAFRELVAGTLGADPDPETQDLHVAILRGRPA
jgi:DNA-binding SARP family transcriptional activator